MVRWKSLAVFGLALGIFAVEADATPILSEVYYASRVKPASAARLSCLEERDPPAAIVSALFPQRVSNRITGSQARLRFYGARSATAQVPGRGQAKCLAEGTLPGFRCSNRLALTSRARVRIWRPPCVPVWLG